MQRLARSARVWIVLALALVLVAGSGVARAQSFAHGAVVGVPGTPHLWIADAQGVLHWAGDTRALAGKYVNWANRTEVSVARLRGIYIGDPWLTAGLLKDGDPIYLVKWETTWARPQLLHIQSIADVELFGINVNNYGRFVLDRAAWEARYGFAAASLQRGVLPSLVAPAPQPTAPEPAPAGPASCPDGQRWDYYKETCVNQTWRERAEDLIDPALMPALDMHKAVLDANGVDGDANTFALIDYLDMPVAFGALPPGRPGRISVVRGGQLGARITVSDAHRGESTRALATVLAHELWHALAYAAGRLGMSWAGCIQSEMEAERAAAWFWSKVRPGSGTQLTPLEQQAEITYRLWVDGELDANVRARYWSTCAA